MFIAALFTVAKVQKQLKCPSMDEWINVININHIIYIYIMEYYSAWKKERKPTICDNMDEHGGYYAK